MSVHVAEEASRTFLAGDSQLLIGWREWVGLPGFTHEPIRAKVDTGARTSALHAQNLSFHDRDERTFASFKVTDGSNNERQTTAEVIEQRAVRSSNGIEEIRPVIVVDLLIGASSWPIELTLTDRESMGFAMLLGRSALRNRCLIDPNRSYCAGPPVFPENSESTTLQDKRLTQ